MARTFNDLLDAWEFLQNHPMTMAGEDDGRFRSLLDITVVRVNPATNEIDDDKSKNRSVRIWLEFGPWTKREELSEAAREYMPSDGVASHDIDLDCGAPTFEEAIMKLAYLVLNKYGDY